MGTRSPIGEFEQLVLLAVMRQDDDAYGVTIKKEIEEQTGRASSRGAVYTTLDRLEAKGYLQSQLGDPLPQRSGKSRRFYRVTDEAVLALQEASRSLRNMWSGLEATLGER